MGDSNSQIPLFQAGNNGVERPVAPRPQSYLSSLEARESVGTFAAQLRRRVLDFVRDRGTFGATCDEAEEILSLTHQGCSPRFTELSKAALIVESGDRRPTRSGRLAAVWIVSNASGGGDGRAP